MEKGRGSASIGWADIGGRGRKQLKGFGVDSGICLLDFIEYIIEISEPTRCELISMVLTKEY